MDVLATLEGKQVYTIHGQPYARLYFSPMDAPDAIQSCQLPAEAYDAELRPGDAIVVTMLLNVAVEIRRRPAG